MRIVFLAHYFPPLNSTGARRVNAFAKYLAMAGHDVSIITTKKTSKDGVLSEEVPSYLRMFELNGFGKLTSSICAPLNQSGYLFQGTNRSLIGVLLLKIKRKVMKYAGQLVDHRLIFALQFLYPWLDISVKERLLLADIVVSTSPPWPVHLAGRIIKYRFSKPWIADYRDQFSGSHIQSGLPLFQKIEFMIDRWLLRAADGVVTISSPMMEYYQRFNQNVCCIENGYDATFFLGRMKELSADDYGKRSPTQPIRIVYMGTITRDRLPKALFRALTILNSNGIRVVAEFYGDSGSLNTAINECEPDAAPYVKILTQLSYVDAVDTMIKADILFFIETSDLSSHSSRGVLTTKLFEYFAARKPIIAEISKRSLAAKYIENSGLGLIISQNASEISNALKTLINNQVKIIPDEIFIDSLSRELKTKELELFCEKLIITS
jgi:glycosyltransferase involved in cell wall biosynthesis